MNEMTNASIKTTFDPQAIYREIQERIATGVYRVGEKLSERGLALEYGVGRFYIKGVFRLLESNGLVEIFPQSGTFVRKLSVAELRECHEVRLSLESAAAYFAALRGATPELSIIAEQLEEMVNKGTNDVFQEQVLGWKFHEEMFRAAKNNQLSSIYANLRGQSGLALTAIRRPDNDVVRKGTVEHLAIFSAIKAQDAILARNLAWEHVLFGLQERLKVFMEIAV
jgi:DNA-binding GntR family transcriptional regulator